MIVKAQRLSGILCGSDPVCGARGWYANGVQLNGPERGVCTSGRGLIDATEERQL